MHTLESPSVAYFVGDLEDLDELTCQTRPGAFPAARRRMPWTRLSRSVRGVLSAAVALFLSACATDSPSAVPPPDPAPQFGYDLVFERRSLAGATELRRVSLDGASAALPVAVTIEGTFIRDPAPSPDGSKIAFTLAWYPEGTSRLDGDVYVVNRDGSGLTRLTTTEDLDDQPTWSPDGARIAFRSRSSGNDDIFVMNADGSNPRNLTNDALPATSTEQNPAWSPDGTRIAYSSDLDSFASPKIWTMSADGGDKRRLTAVSAAAERDFEPSWSPDGAQVAFRRVGSSTTDIMIVTVAGGAVERLPLDGVQAAPAWSPDGALIAFQSNHEDGRFQIYTMRPNGSDVTRRANNGVDDQYPRWIRASGSAAVAAPSRHQMVGRAFD